MSAISKIFLGPRKHESRETLARELLTRDNLPTKCVLPKQLLLGDNKLAGEYAVGDTILSEGGLEQVIQVDTLQSTGSMCKIKAEGCLPLTVTPNHPLMIHRRVSDKRHIVYDLPDHRGVVDASLTPEWIPASEVRLGDFAVIPRFEQNCHAKVTKEFAWFLGLYVAEGNGGGRQFALTMHAKEGLTLEKAASLIQELGIKCDIYKRKESNSIQLIAWSTKMTQQLVSWCGHGALNKRIPEFILFGELDVLRSFIEGYELGDGYVNSIYNRIQSGTVSETLALQLQLALARLGELYRISWDHINPSQLKNGRCIKPSIGGQFYLDRRIRPLRHYMHITLPDRILVPVRANTLVPYDGPVVNVQESSHTFLVNNVVTHNTEIARPLAVAVADTLAMLLAPTKLRNAMIKESNPDHKEEAALEDMTDGELLGYLLYWYRINQVSKDRKSRGEFVSALQQTEFAADKAARRVERLFGLSQE